MDHPEFPAQPRSPPPQQWKWQQAMSATNSSTWPGSYLFAPEFKPTDDLLTVDADDKFWYYYKDDVSTAQHVLAQARDTKHSSSPGTVKLLRVINQCHDGRQKQDLAAVLDVCQQELAEQGTINSRLQAGICDSFEALGAYMMGMPSAILKHRQYVKNATSAIRQGASLQQFQGMELAGGVLVPPADERPGNMDPSEYLVTLAPKLLALQHLRQEPFKPHTFAEYKTKGGLPTNRPPRMEGMARLQEMLKREWEPQQRLNLKGALDLLKMEYQHKHSICQCLWYSCESLCRRLQWYMTSTLALRWHIRWLAGEQMDMPADWIYATLESRGRSRDSGNACSYSPGPRPDISYQIWLHDRSSTTTPSGSYSRPSSASPGRLPGPTTCAGAEGMPARPGLGQPRSPMGANYASPGSSYGTKSSVTPPAVQATFCLAAGEEACRFMWYTAPPSWSADAQGATRMVLGTVLAASSCNGVAASAEWRSACCSPAPGARVTVVAGPKPQAAAPDPAPQLTLAPSPISTLKPGYRPVAANTAPVASCAAVSNSTGSSPSSPHNDTGSASGSPKRRWHPRRRTSNQLVRAQPAEAAGSGSNTLGQDSNSTDAVSLEDPATASQPTDAVSTAVTGISPEERRRDNEAACNASTVSNSASEVTVPAPAAAVSYAAAAVSGMVRATMFAPRQSITPRRVSTEPPDTGNVGGSSNPHCSASSGLRASKSCTNGRPSSAGSINTGSSWRLRTSSTGFPARLSEGSRSASIMQQFKAPPVPAPKSARVAGAAAALNFDAGAQQVVP